MADLGRLASILCLLLVRNGDLAAEAGEVNLVGGHWLLEGKHLGLPRRVLVFVLLLTPLNQTRVAGELVTVEAFGVEFAHCKATRVQLNGVAAELGIVNVVRRALQ